MMAHTQKKVNIIPVEQPFLRVLAEYVHETLGSSEPDFSKILMIFPSQRNKFYFRRYLLETSSVKSIMPPVMKTLDEMIEYCYECSGGKRGALLNNIERNFLLKDVIDEFKVKYWKDMPFLRFVAVGRRLLNFFDELAKEQVTFNRIETEAKLGHYPEKYVMDELPILRKIYDAYRAVLKETAYQDAIDLCQVVHEEFNPECLRQYDHILLTGLAATTVVETELIRRILDELPSQMVLHSCSPDELKNMNQPDKPFYVHHKLLHALHVDPSKIRVLKGGEATEPVMRIRETKTEAEQTLYLHSIVRECVARHNELHRIVIVLPDESIVYPVVESLKAAGVAYNLSAGLPLARSLLYSFLEQLHEVIQSDFHFEELFTFIRHPLFKNAIINGQSLRPLIYGLEDFMIQNRLNSFKRADFVESRFDPLIDILQRGFSAVQGNNDFSDYLEGLVNYLTDLLGYNEQFIKTNTPDIKEFFEQLHRLSKLRVTRQMPARSSDALGFILWVLKDHRYRVEGDPMRGIQVIGLLEARNLDFDCLILPSMNEGIFPRRSEKDMFINQKVRSIVGLPDTQGRENLYYYYYTELTKGKKEVYISYVAEEERDVASRFINLQTTVTQRDDSVTKLARTAFELNKREVKKTPEMIKSLYQYLQHDGLSPTALSDYRKCPYRYYLKYMVRITEPKMIMEEPGAKEWGEVMHSAVRNFYRYHFPRGFSEPELSQAESVMERELEKALARNRSLAVEPKAATFIDLNVFKTRMHHFLQTEVLRFKDGFEIFKAALERKAKHHIAVNGAQVRVYGYIDRIDLKKEQYYIIDYKTGRIPSRSTFEIGDDFTEFQLPLYALMFSKEHFDIVGGMMYYEIGRQSRTIDIVEGKDAVAYLNDFKNQILIPTVAQILDPEVPFYQTDNDDFCEHCIYRQVCGEVHGRQD
jgi:ATP-dependent helicase/nuclease subunit B